MVVHDLDILGSGGGPDEAHAELVVDPDAVLARPISLERLEPIAGRDPQVIEPPAISSCLSLRRATDSNATKRFTRLPLARASVSESRNETIMHVIVTRRVNNVKHD